MYMAVQRTAQDMPVIASVQQTSASGGYYTMLPAETIYVLPTSVTGSVGLAAGAPQPSEPVRGPSGPDKRGSNIIGTWATQETVADTFINTVMEQRSEQLEVPRSEVAHAKVYLGTRAVQNGFADKIGSVDEAIREAADEAELDTYQVVNRDIGVSGSPFGLEANAEPFLIRNDNRVFVVQGENPGVGDVRPMQFPLVHEEAVPHVDTVETVTNTELIAHTDQTEQRSQTTRPGGESQ
jgi:protease-4